MPYGDLKAVAAAITPNTAAIFMEPIQGEGGVLIPPAGFLKGLRKLADDNHCLLVLDEIQSGFGRTGKMFAFEHEGIRPDGITVGKALSGGFYPVSAFLSSKEVMDVFTPGIHGSTYGGNPLACAVATAALDVLIDEHLVERSAELGLHFKARLEGIKSKKVKAIRCRGLWAGIDLTDDAGPAKSYCYALKACCARTPTSAPSAWRRRWSSPKNRSTGRWISLKPCLPNPRRKSWQSISRAAAS